jgi:TolB-like protein/Tfp pilus assembly protein PilF
MKRCPQCGREYDNTMMFCLDDGAELLYGPGSIDESTTVRFHLTDALGDGRTRHLMHTTGETDHSNAVAVLPFANLSSSEDSEYFSDGLAEELLNVLSKIKGLRVAARTSAFAFKGKQATVEEIGRALHVQSVLEGSVRMAGERVRIAVQLVDTVSGYHIWSETYDRTLDDIFAIQDDIAQSVVGELRKRLLGTETDPNARDTVADEVAKAIKGRATEPEAHRLMLLGRHLLERGNEADAVKAVEYFRQALEIDPGYARCWGQLGRTLYLASNYGWRAIETDYVEAEKAFQKALDLEPDLAEVLARLGRLRWVRDGEYLEVQRCLKRALELAPHNIDVLLVAANTANELGQFEKAIEYSRRATDDDPLSQGSWSAFAFSNFLAEDLSTAESAYRRALELAPQRISIRALLGLVLFMLGRHDEAVAEASLEPDNDLWRPWALTIIHHGAGRHSESDAALAKLIVEFPGAGAFQIAEAYSMRSEIDKAFEWLDRAIDQRDPGRFTTKSSPLLEQLHGDPRWSPLLKKIGFPD